jgi:serine/threonine-protein kinase
MVGVCYRDGEKLVSHEAFVVAESDPMRGRVIGGKYRILERVGQGGMGTVYRALQAGLNRQVAV